MKRIVAAAALAATVLASASTAATRAPVADAAMQADLATVRDLLRAGVDVNAPQGDGMTALHWAAHHDAVELAEVLLYAGANPEAGTRIGRYTPLHIASQKGRAAVTAALLRGGANANAMSTGGGGQPLHFAAASGDADTVRALLAGGALLDGVEQAWEQTPVMFAAANNRRSVVELLIEAGADPSRTSKLVDIAAREKADREARKARGKQREALRKLDEEPKKKGDEKSNEKEDENEEGEDDEPSPEGEDDDADDAPASPEDDDPEAEQAQTEAVESEHPEVKKALEPEPSELAGATEASEADQLERPEPAKPRSYGQLVGNQGGLAAIHYAAREGHREVVEALLRSGVDIDQVTAGDYTSPLLIATLNGHFDLAMWLLESGGDPNLASDAGAVPLHAALDVRWAPKASYPQQNAYRQQKTSYLDLMQALLEAGADPDKRLEKHLWYASYNFDHLLDLTGATPFWRASYATDLEAMKLLVAHGADPLIPTAKVPTRRPGMNVQDEEKKTEDLSGVPEVPVGGPAVYPLHAAVGAGYGERFSAHAHNHVPDGWMPVVRYLVEELGADVNARDERAFTPLHHAAARGDTEMVIYLINHGARADALSRKGQTTADMANGPVQRVRPFEETRALLEFLGSKNNQKCLSC